MPKIKKEINRIAMAHLKGYYEGFEQGKKDAERSWKTEKELLIDTIELTGHYEKEEYAKKEVRKALEEVLKEIEDRIDDWNDVTWRKSCYEGVSKNTAEYILQVLINIKCRLEQKLKEMEK